MIKVRVLITGSDESLLCVCVHFIVHGACDEIHPPVVGARTSCISSVYIVYRWGCIFARDLTSDWRNSNSYSYSCLSVTLDSLPSLSPEFSFVAAHHSLPHTNPVLHGGLVSKRLSLPITTPDRTS